MAEIPVTSPTVKVRTLASGLAFPEGPIAMADGSVMVTEIVAGTLTRIMPDGGIERIAELGGGPNGAAIGPDGAVYVCNNGGSFSFHRQGDLLVFGLEAPPSYSGGSIDRVPYRLYHLFGNGALGGGGLATAGRASRLSARVMSTREAI